jgi:cytochrome c553
MERIHPSCRFAGHAMLVLVLALAAGMNLRAQAADAATRPDAAKGKGIAADVCAPCHSADGNSVVSTNPKLAGQHAGYLVKQLADLAMPPTDKGARENPVMSGIAATLSPEDRANLAAWFSSQESWTPGGSGDKQAAQTGARLYGAGQPEKAVPACAGCHGPTGNGLPSVYPKIAGQFSDYVEAQLRAFRDGSRHNNEAMGQIAFRLSDPEIKALSEYVAAMRGQ